VPGVSAVACPSSRVSCPGVEILWQSVHTDRRFFPTEELCEESSVVIDLVPQ
jgi:hypothetical protein